MLGAISRPPIRSGDAFPSIALEIVYMDRDVTVMGFSIQGFDIGVRVNESACSDCELILADGSIEFGPGPARDTLVTCGLSPTRTGIYFADAPGRVRLERIKIGGVGGGVTCVDPSLIFPIGGATGIYFSQSPEESLVLSDLELRAAGGSSGQGLDVMRESNATLEAKNVLIEGFRTGMRFSGHGATITNLTVRCGEAPILFKEGAGPLENGVSVGLHLPRVPITRISGAVVENCPSAGLEAGQFDDFQVSSLEARSNGYGVYLHSGSGLHPGTGLPVGLIRRAIIEKNGYIGLAVAAFPVRLLDSSVAANGKDWQGGSRGVRLTRFGGIVAENAPQHVAMVVAGSQIVGNVPYGATTTSHYQGTDSVSFINATDNWWGDASGPRLRTGDDPSGTPVGPGSGDIVSEGVQFVPYRSSPLAKALPEFNTRIA